MYVYREGHTSMIKECAEQLLRRPDVVILSVGGGGLLCGVAQGMDEVGWGEVPLLCMETIGVDCFNRSVKAGHRVTLSAITRFVFCTLACFNVNGSFQVISFGHTLTVSFHW